MITEAQLKAALRKHGGVYVLAAQELKCTRQNVWARVKDSEELQTYVAEIEEEIIDAAEAVVKDAILKKDRQMTRWYLERKGKHRGYTTRTELTGEGGVPLPATSIQVQISYVDPNAEPAATEDVI